MSFNRYVRMAARLYGISVDELIGERRTLALVDLRIAAAVCMRRRGWGMSRIGLALSRDHTTILSGLRSRGHLSHVVRMANAIDEALDTAATKPAPVAAVQVTSVEVSEPPKWPQKAAVPPPVHLDFTEHCSPQWWANNDARFRAAMRELFDGGLGNSTSARGQRRPASSEPSGLRSDIGDL